MLKEKVLEALNRQIEVEAFSSNLYLAMASWCDKEGLEGCAKFFYDHSEEERMHMMKLIHYINEAGGHAIVNEIKKPKSEFKDAKEIFEQTLEHEKFVTSQIDKLVELSFTEKDFATYNFLQWYVDEQHEEETLFSTVLDKVNMIGVEGRGLYFIDKEVARIHTQNVAQQNA